jgi:hypothetical protein
MVVCATAYSPSRGNCLLDGPSTQWFRLAGTHAVAPEPNADAGRIRAATVAVNQLTHD